MPGRRIYSIGDVFEMAVAGYAIRSRFTWPVVRDILAALPPVELDEQFIQKEPFAGYAHFRDAVLVVTGLDDDLQICRFVEREDLAKLGAEPFVSFPATRIARLVEAAVRD